MRNFEADDDSESLGKSGIITEFMKLTIGNEKRQGQEHFLSIFRWKVE